MDAGGRDTLATPITPADLAWLRDLDRLLRSGLNRTQAAAQMRVCDQTISNRLRGWGLRIVWEPRIGSATSGRELEALLAAGELELAERPRGHGRAWRPLQRALGLFPGRRE